MSKAHSPITCKSTKYAVDWVAFDTAAQARGAHRLEVQDATIPAQSVPPTVAGGRGRPHKYSSETVLNMLRLALVMRMSFRETEGYVRALRDKHGYTWDVPDHSTLCRRMQKLDVSLSPAVAGDRLVFLVDSTGLKLSGPGEWRARHPKSGRAEVQPSSAVLPPLAEAPAEPLVAEKQPKRRQWRKAHLAVEYFSGQVVGAELTAGTASDTAQLAQVLAGQPLGGAFVCADGAYHNEDAFRLVHDAGGKLLARPPYNAATWPLTSEDPAIAWRNLQIDKRNELGQKGWAHHSGYSKRSLVETHNARLKLYTGSALRCRHADSQKVELLLRLQLINTYQALWTEAGGTHAVRIA